MNLGLAETLQLLIGKDHTSEEGMAIAKDIYQLFSDRCNKYKEEYKLNFGQYNTPKQKVMGVARVTLCKNNLTKRANVISW